VTTPATPRPRVEVAVGILLQPDGAFLLGTRPAGKPYAGYWEFPGGKVEPGESVAQALERELLEELGINAQQIALWQVTEHDYPHAQVRLHWCKVHAWQGTFDMREGQQVRWQRFPLDVAPVLPGAHPILALLARERGTVHSPA